MHALDCFPGNPVSHWLAGSTEDWEWVQPRVITENLFQIIRCVDIVDALERLSFLFEVLDRCFVLPCQLNVELQEGGNQEADHSVYYERKYDYYCIPELFVIFSHELVFEAPLECLIEVICHEYAGEVHDA